MAAFFHIDIITPEHSFYTGETQGVIVGTPDGELCVLANHAPLVTPLNVGSIQLNIDGEWKEAFLSEGFMEVSHKGVVIFTQACEFPSDIDIARAAAVMQRASEKLRQKTSTREYRTNKIALARAMARLRVTHTQQYNK
ncbi:MAG: ATP synthase F1 subunit epsilon [Oscillospiraceae bacterium]|jgi:F-type H+-transporting ATPase subunit epsilon|nr:ATP synthase F1 subunit epsilon [Oscillospiraceae bacterium]